MSRIKEFTPNAWQDYMWFFENDKRGLKRINKLIDNIDSADPFSGLGKPEPLRYGLGGWWSRQINHEDRLVYKVTEKRISILACKYRYGDATDHTNDFDD